MPYKSGGKWKWGNIERKSKEDLRKTVYGIWMKNGGEGSFSTFWKTGRVDEASEDGRHKFFSITDGGREVGKYGLSFYDDIRAVGIGSFEIYPEYRNRGYGTDTLKKIISRYSGSYDLIYCFVDAGNEGAIRLYRKLGAEISGHPNTAGQYMVVFYRGENGVMQESADNDMIERLFNEAIRDYRTMLDIDLSYMKYKISTQPVYTNGEPCFEYKPEECAGDWTELGWIRLNPDIQSVKDYYGISDMPDEDFMRAIIRHELAHEIWNKHSCSELKDKVLSAAKESSFSTKYLKTVDRKKLDEETFCEWLAVIDMPYKASSGKWKWGNIERKSKEDLRKVVYGIQMKGGSKCSFSKFWEKGTVSESEYIQPKTQPLPKTLYHATYKSLIEKIKTEGLGGKSSKPNWSDSKQGVTYWSIDADVAYSYAEAAEDVPDEWLDEIVVFSCNIKNFDLKKLFVDTNVIDNEGITLEYHDIIPYNKLKDIHYDN